MLLCIMKKKYPVMLSETEREELKRLIAAGTAPARKLTHAHVLLQPTKPSPGRPGLDAAAPAGSASRRAS